MNELCRLVLLWKMENMVNLLASQPGLVWYKLHVGSTRGNGGFASTSLRRFLRTQGK